MKIPREVKEGYSDLFKNALRDNGLGVLPYPPHFREWLTVGELVQAVDDDGARSSLEEALRCAMGANDAGASHHLMQFVARASQWYGEVWADAWADQIELEREKENGR